MKKIYLLILILLANAHSYSQEVGSTPYGQKDFQLWLDAGLNYKINKKLDLAFEAAYRRNNNLANVSETYVELQLKYDPYKFLLFSGGYRFSGWYERFTVNRLFIYARFKFNASRFRFQYRIRYDNNFNSNSRLLPNYLRNKIKIRYRTRKFPLDPYVAFEFFYKLNHWDKRVTQQRMDIGLQYSVSKRHSLKGYYRYQQRLNTKSPNKNFILGFSYSYDL